MTERPTWIGKILGGRYRIDEIIGQGGMSAVYKAYDPNLRRVVAIKLIHPHLADDPRFVTRFEEEAAAVAQLRHPNIVQVYDFNHDADLYYMVQEFLPGETLQDRLRRLLKGGRQIAVAEGSGFILDICDASGFAHRRGMIHRDIKPANIMINVQNQAILMDFGIVKITGGTSHTATGAVVGTAMYLAPEIIRGETADPRSDIYSLGVVLFEVLGGKPPFQADSAMTLMMMHLNDPVPDLQELRPDVPAGLAQVVQKALEKNRQNRYQSMEEMAAAIRAALDEKPVDISAGRTVVEDYPGVIAVPGVVAASVGAVPEAANTGADQSGVGAGVVPVEQGNQEGRQDTTRQAQPSHTVVQQGEGRTIAEKRPDTAPQPALVSPEQSQSANARRRESESSRIPAVSQPGSSPEGKASQRRFLWFGGAGVLVVLVILVIYFISRSGSGGTPPLIAAESSSTPEPATQEVAAISEDSPTATATATVTPQPTATLPPTATATLALPPTATFPAGVPFSFINAITIDDQQRYVVDYDTLEFTEELPGEHVHFFFNTVPPEEAGLPGSGPWILYGGPRPFTRYAPKDRPQNAYKMCVLVANPNHSVQPESGNCFFLPDVNAVTILKDTACTSGADPGFPAIANLLRGDEMLVNGLSQDEKWWNVSDPSGDQIEACWVPVDLAYFHGDLSTISLVESPPKPDELFVEITTISMDDQDRYVVEFLTSGFEPALPGTHIHFYFNTISPDQVGMDGGGNRLMHGSPSPFTGYSANDRPEGADQLCALVAKPDHSVILESGNCFSLP